MRNCSDDESCHEGFPVELDHPAFFKLFLPQNNAINLYIPPPFIRNFHGNIPGSISLKNESGSVWPAKLKYIGKKLYITDGWELFAKDHKLKPEEFLVFKYIQNSTFIVTVFDSDGMLKIRPEDTPTSERAIVATTPADIAASNAILAGNVRFYKTFRKKFNNNVAVPKYVIDVCGIVELPQTVNLTNEHGSGIKIPLRRSIDRVVLGYKGLPRFWKKIGVKQGDTIGFEVICEGEGRVKQIIVTKTNALGIGC